MQIKASTIHQAVVASPNDSRHYYLCPARDLLRGTDPSTSLILYFGQHTWPPPTSFLTGNLTEYHDPDGWEFQRKLEQNYGRIVRFQGLLGARALFVFDPAALQSILIKDQNIYEEQEDFISVNSILFGPGIISTLGDHHRKFRKIMIPAFSTANLRRMVPIFYEVVQRLDLNNILSRTSLELIGQTGIGYSFDPMLPGKERTDQYARALKGYCNPAVQTRDMATPPPCHCQNTLPAFLRFMISVLPVPALREIRDLVDFMSATALNLVKERKEAIRNVKSNMSSEEGCASPTKSSLLPPQLLSSPQQTQPSSLNRLLHIIAQNPDIQDKLRAEILGHPETMDHDTIVGLPYLDAVIRETMRL
ncbi:cytochrome P450 [Mycena leptocephala]|nr:cytochrome P450 [Mycena leptocephala]